MKETKQFCTGAKLVILHNLILKLTVQVLEDHILCAGVADRHVDISYQEHTDVDNEHNEKHLATEVAADALVKNRRVMWSE